MDESKKPLQPGQNPEERPLPFSERNHKIKDRLDGLLKGIHYKKFDEIQEKIVVFVSRLREKYPDSNKYELMHIITGSGIPTRANFKPLEDDFPGEDSVEKFIDGLLEEYKK